MVIYQSEGMNASSVRFLRGDQCENIELIQSILAVKGLVPFPAAARRMELES